ncbi:hypothetical protein ACIGHF_02690 [Stenotrophomonas sp. NPDC077464]|uniref:hypothetical protein n=1 Tax=unclassified Stenotrophomonas TaxID=196198 RepID=UPI0037CE7DBB
MAGIIGELLEGIADFVTDVWLLRRQRSASGRPGNRWGTDAADVAVFNAWAIGLSIAAVALAAILFFVLKLPPWIGLAPVVAAGIYLGYRWLTLARA